MTLKDKEYNPDSGAEAQLDDSFYPKDKNDYSIALLLTFGNFSYFTAGDLSSTFEKDVAYHVNYFYGPITVWKAGHHGAQTSSSPGTVGFLQGRFCVLSCGTDNMHGHPHQATIDHLESLNDLGVPCAYYATGQAQAGSSKPQPGVLGKNGADDKGTIIVRARQAAVKDQEAFEVWTEKNNTSKAKDGWEQVVCDARKAPRTQNSQAAVQESSSSGKASKPLSEKKKQEKKDRKKQRSTVKLDRAREMLNKAITSNLPADGEMSYRLQMFSEDNKEWFESYVKRLAQRDLDDRYIGREVDKMAKEIIRKLHIT